MSGIQPSRIPLSNRAFEGANNAYLFKRDGETALVDTGINMPETRKQFEARLAEHGITFTDIDIVVLTHWHGDHVGLAERIQSTAGATVYAHEADAPLIEHRDDPVRSMREIQFERYDQWGMPPLKQRELEAYREQSRKTHGAPVDVEPVEDGDVIDLAGTDVKVIHTPGHTAGHLALAFDAGDQQCLLTGDTLLPEYTPNVGGADVRVNEPLVRYFETLEWITTADFDRALPGHRDPIEAPIERAHEILNHHENRTSRVLAVLEKHGPADAWTVSAKLFGDLEGIHILHGPGEAYAHLDYLERDERIVRTGTEYDV